MSSANPGLAYEDTPPLSAPLRFFLTAPVSANLMAKAALHLRVPSKAGHQPVDEAQAHQRQG